MFKKINNKLSIQLFVSTFLVIMLIIVTIVAILHFSYDYFYNKYKENKLEKQFNNVIEILETEDVSYSDLLQIESSLSYNENADIIITTQDGLNYKSTLLLKEPIYSIEAVDSYNNTIRFLSSQSYNMLMGLYNTENTFQFKIGEKYNVVYDNLDNNFISLVHIADDTVDFASTATAIITEVEDYLKNDTITIKQVDLATQSEIKDYWSNDYLFGSYITQVSLLDPKCYTLEKEIQDIHGNKLNVNLTASFTSVTDATSALVLYYPYFFLISLVTATVVSYIYARKVSKPIVEISGVAENMSKLDFSNKLLTQPNNEIGTLCNSINSLSCNLEKALSDLTDANTKLSHDIKQKKKQEQARREFVANVSHELKTPLGAMRCYIESLKDKVVPHKQDEYYDSILVEIKKMTHLVMEMLELAKVESGDVQLDITEFSLHDMLMDNITLHEFQANDKDMSIIIKGEFPNIKADPRRFDHICSNFISNAVNHGLPSTNILIEGKISDAKCRVSIVNMCDKISDDDIEKFFRRFYMGDKSRNKSGTGLGLAICSAILEAHGIEYGIISHEDSIEVWFEYDIR